MSLDVITKTKGLFFKYMEISKAIHKITMCAVHTNYGTREERFRSCEYLKLF